MASNITNTPNPNLIPLIIDKNDLVRTGFHDKYNELLDTTIFNIYLDITTNELVFQRDSGDLIMEYSLSGLPDVDTSNLASGDILAYDGTKWVAQTIDQAYNYTNSGQSTRFSDITSVSSIRDALNKILYPYVEPSFQSLSIDSVPYTLEYGQYISTSVGGSNTFSFSLPSMTNVSTNNFILLDLFSV